MISSVCYDDDYYDVAVVVVIAWSLCPYQNGNSIRAKVFVAHLCITSA